MRVTTLYNNVDNEEDDSIYDLNNLNEEELQSNLQVFYLLLNNKFNYHVKFKDLTENNSNSKTDEKSKILNKSTNPNTSGNYNTNSSYYADNDKAKYHTNEEISCTEDDADKSKDKKNCIIY